MKMAELLSLKMYSFTFKAINQKTTAFYYVHDVDFHQAL